MKSMNPFGFCGNIIIKLCRVNLSETPNAMIREAQVARSASIFAIHASAVGALVKSKHQQIQFPVDQNKDTKILFFQVLFLDHI